MPLLMLIRHGENDFSKRGILAGRRRGVHLNARGHEQASALSKGLGCFPIVAVYSSPLERAVETATPLARALDQDVLIDAGLVESDVGDWEGKPVRRLARTKYWRIVQSAPSRAGHPGGESFIETQTRVVSALEIICGRHKSNQLVACVLHSDPIRLAVAHFIGLPLDHFQRLACEPASVTLLMIGPSGASLLWLNRTAPFPESPGRGKQRAGGSRQRKTSLG